MNLWTTSSRICLRDNDRPLHNGETSFCSYNVRAMASYEWARARIYARIHTHTRDVKTRVLCLKIVRGVSVELFYIALTPVPSNPQIPHQILIRKKYLLLLIFQVRKYLFTQIVLVTFKHYYQIFEFT